MDPQIDLVSTNRALAENVPQLQQQLAEATDTIACHQNELTVAAQKVVELETQSKPTVPKINKPTAFAKMKVFEFVLTTRL